MTEIDYDKEIEETMQKIEELTQRIMDKLDNMIERQEMINNNVEKLVKGE